MAPHIFPVLRIIKEYKELNLGITQVTKEEDLFDYGGAGSVKTNGADV